MFRHHHTDERFAAAHADVDALLQRLGRDVTTLQDGDDPVNRQALADAGERFETAEGQLGKAQSVAELLVARSIAVVILAPSWSLTAEAASSVRCA